MLIVLFLIAQCDGLGTGPDHDSPIAAAKAFYEYQLEQMAESAEFIGVRLDGHRIALERPPNWSSALVLHHPDGHRVIAAPLDGPPLRTTYDSTASAGTIIFELDGDGQVQEGRILEFVRFGRAPESQLARTLSDYWHAAFEDSLVVVAEFNLRYESQRARVFRPDQPPGAAALQNPGASISKTNADCRYWIMCYYDRNTGNLLYCDGSSLMLMYCIGGDDDCSSGDSCAGGGGGDDDDDTDEEECACDDPIPCEMEAEYRERNPGFTITCDMFTSSGGSAHFSWAELNGFWAGGNESNHRPWGYISPGLPGHLEKVRVNYLAIEGNTATGLPLSSGYRCPDGNASISTASRTSAHMEGRAADVSSRYGCAEVEAAFRAAGADIDTCDEHADHIHGQW